MSFRRGSARYFVAGIATGSLLALACASSSPSSRGVQDPQGGDASDPGPAEDGAVADARLDAGADAPSGSCVGACKTTALVVDIGGKKRTLARAQFGTQQGAAGPEIHTESHLGGMAACPSASSPSPDYTLLVTPIPRGSAGKKLSDRDGITSSFFDFKGDLGLAAPSGITKALGVTVTVVGEDTATPPTWVALDVIAAFTEGEVRGHLYAEYCDSLSQ